MTGKSKFGFEPLAPDSVKPRKREVGPMGAAVREAAGSLAESTESLVEQRRQNATDAKSFRTAQGEGRVLEVLRVDEIRTDDLPRDRIDLAATAGSDEMEELKSSIRARGQKEPIEVFRTETGFQLKKGWRRLTALKQLWQETGDPRFGTVTARVSLGPADRIDLYIDMVEENVIREDLSFAEMAQVAITAAGDGSLDGQGADALVGRIFASLHKMKRSYIRSFVFLLQELGDVLPYPKAISRNLGVEVARRIQASPETSQSLRQALVSVSSIEEQTDVLSRNSLASASRDTTGRGASPKKAVKYEFHVGKAKITARKGECRILSDTDFSAVDRKRLQSAIEAFHRALEEE
ncbi:chromosome partitioning protein ParB (plasmid) [Paracoccus liaowanqingii]|uniref:Chromosome partitioning protein ParB n=1 Tax=Paracoccus liaowanqingii TaxID=2560053 RepID=A0A4Y5SS48_9RHOB|nr:ParB N-terminal domain-containing protein [Paracoccus liaowanqingii]QDA36330.1 chromosome partitioning protein ParB [Paracoccus liaowanqingii]